MRRITLVATVVLLAGCDRGKAPSARGTAELGQPATEVAADLFVCPEGYGWPGYGHVVYAPNDTSKPAANVRPDRCFSSLDEATRGGFHLASPPAGVLIDSISLVPPNPPLAPICQEAARRLGFTVLCPGLVPGDSNSITPCERRDCVVLRSLVLTFTFSGPPGYVGIPWERGDNHLFVLEARAGRERTVPFLGCEGPQTSEPLSVRGHPGEWIHCLDGETMNSGHVMLVWKERGIRYVVSLHSDTFTNRVIAAAVANGLAPTPAA
jgi:hypothetical protein